MRCRLSPFKANAVCSLLILSSLFAAPSYANTTNEVDELVNQIIEQRKIPGLQLAIIKNGEIIKLQGYGQSNVQDAVKVSNDTVFPINSMTKLFTGVAIMQLAQAGKLNVDDAIGTHLPELPAKWHHLTIKQLLSHASGLPNILSGRQIDLIANNNPKAAWELVQTLPMKSSVNSQFSYNQTGYVVLGKIIDKLAQQPFNDFIIEQQLQKVGMPATANAGFGYLTYVVQNQARQYIPVPLGNS
ncbi:MAG: beta-lactamase family protein [Psychrobium sp.]|nr:beta-lactamase family protein [Psychrobium sp.]